MDVANLTFEEGGRYALIGANGSGKSTLLKIIDGQLGADVGQNIDKKQYKVAYMPQQSYAFSMSVKRNILLPAAVADRENAKERMQGLVSALGLKSLLYKNAARLSGGETQRMALARTLMVDCKVLLLDEPTAAMDVEQAKAVLELLKVETEKRGLTLIFATHSLKQAEELADEILFMANGVVVERGTPEKLLHSPVYSQTKAFIGFNR